MINLNKISNICLYGTTHALVDATCVAAVFAGLLFNHADAQTSLFLILLYNVLAFGLQPAVGMVFDKLKTPRLAADLGCILTIAAAIVWKISLPAVIFAGLGNALFHIGGGIISLKMSGGKATIPGMYVAPGALGLFVGILTGKSGHFSPLIFITLLLISLVLITVLPFKSAIKNKEKGKTFHKFELIISLLFVSIVIRSLIGLGVVFPWKTNMNLLILLTLAVVFGKFFGGIIADRFGWVKTSVAGLLLSAPLITLGIQQPFLAIAGMFCFNLTMPVTLVVIANTLKHREGFAFGLTALALIIGALPTFAGLKFGAQNGYEIVAIIILSAILLYLGLKIYFKEQ